MATYPTPGPIPEPPPPAGNVSPNARPSVSGADEIRRQEKEVHLPEDPDHKPIPPQP